MGTPALRDTSTLQLLVYGSANTEEGSGKTVRARTPGSLLGNCLLEMAA